MVFSEDSTLLRCISSALEMYDQGLDPPLEEICGGREDLMVEVAAAVQLARKLPTMQRDVAGQDTFANRVLGGRYRLESRMGAGSMGVVYRAEDMDLGRFVAVKILRSDMLAIEEAEARFVREAEALAAIQHPSVVTVHDRGRTDDGALFLVMELLEGLSLSELVEEVRQRGGAGQLEDTGWLKRELELESVSETSFLRTAVRWTADLASGLRAAHEGGIFHRDVKPSNIFVRREGPPVLLDFGIAARDSQATIVERDSALGTPAYMAPEVLDNAEARPERDVYGLAATLYHLLTLRPPYSGTPSQVIGALARGEPTPAYRLRPGLPRDLQAILDRGMAREVSARYPTASDLEADLRAFLDYRPVSARPVAPWYRVLRKLARSNTFRAGAAVALLALGLWGVVAARSAWLDEQRDHTNQIWSHAPPMLTLWNAADRLLVDEGERSTVELLLDRTVEASVTPLPGRLYRAGFRLDHGQAARAAEDMRVIAKTHKTPYLRELAARYERLSEKVQGASSLDTRDLPRLEEAMDAYVAGYHLLRVASSPEEYERVESLLADERLADFAPAQEILLPVQVALLRYRPSHARKDEARRIYERTVRLEESLGRRTATTSHVLGGALLGQELYADAVAPLKAGIELAPNSHGMRINLGIAARRIGDLEEARTQLEAAIDLRPGALNSYRTLARVHAALREFESARQTVEQAPFSDSDRSRWTELVLRGEIEYALALDLFAEGDGDGASAAALDAIDLFTQTGQFGEEYRGPERILSEAIVEDDFASAYVQLFEILEQDPANWRRLDTVIELMPPELSVLQTTGLRAYLGTLSDHFAQKLEAEPTLTDQSSSQ
jgi:serine/threonine protein kinase